MTVRAGGPGRRVLVTGASRGIGAAVATAFARSGDRVALHCRADVASAEAVAAGLPGSGHVVVAADLARDGASEAVAATTLELLGGIDVLVNNAAIYEDAPIDASSLEQWRAVWRRTLATNLLGPADLVWCVADHWLHRPEGPSGAVLVTVGSRGAYRGEPTAPAYGASKAAVTSMTQSLAVALGRHGIVCSAVAPGFVRTDMAAGVLAGPHGPGIEAQSPWGRVAEPAEVAEVVHWLASPAARWASGTVVDCNGASYLR